MAADKPPTFFSTSHSSPLPEQQRGLKEERATPAFFCITRYHSASGTLWHYERCL